MFKLFFIYFSFSVATKNVKILLQVREVLNFERHPSNADSDDSDQTGRMPRLI